MNLIDLHCDTFWKTIDLGGVCVVDAIKLKEAHSIAQFFASFIYTDGGNYEGTFEKALCMIDKGKEILSGWNDVEIAFSLNNFKANMKNKKVSALLSVEEGGILEGDIDRLHILYEKGVRMMTLLWNYENCLGFPNGKVGGLKPFGIEVVSEMDKMGMIVDVSHMSDDGFWDVVRESKRPFLASHSNARTLCNHSRNLSDDMIKAISNRGGLIGLNFYPYFVNQKGKICAADLVKHVKHIINVGGEDVIALGSDFDGYDEGISDINSLSDVYLLEDAMKKMGISNGICEKIFYKNVIRFLDDYDF